MEENELLEIIKRLQTRHQEWKTVDAKQELVLKENGDKAEFVKDVIAMGNNGEQSYLVIGLEDGTFMPVGLLSRHYNSNELNQIVVDKIEPPLVIDYQEFVIEGNEYAVISVLGRNPPYIVARDLTNNLPDRKKVKIYRGTIYVRHEDRTEGISRSELDGFYRSELRKAYESETEAALQLALNRPQYWEYLLTAELLQVKTARVRRALADLDRGLIHKRTVRMDSADFLNWASLSYTDLSALMNLLKTAITEEIPRSWGGSGESGDPLEIKRAVETVILGCNDLLEWETDLRSIEPPKSFIPLKQMMTGWTLHACDLLDDMTKRTLECLQPGRKGEFVIEIVFTTPSNFRQAMAELERLKNHPEEWRADY